MTPREIAKQKARIIQQRFRDRKREERKSKCKCQTCGFCLERRMEEYWEKVKVSEEIPTINEKYPLIPSLQSSLNPNKFFTVPKYKNVARYSA